jgi:hypothetical protein
MLHPVQDPPGKPGPSLPGCSLGEYPRQHYPTQSQVPYGMQPPRQHEVRLVITRILRPLHTPRPGGRRFPPPATKMLRAPACGIMFVPHIMPPAPQESRSDAAGIALRERRSSRPHRTLARPPQGAGSSAVLVIPGASAFVPHLCSLVIPAGSLDPAPCGGKEHLSVLRSQNPAFTGFAKHRQSKGRGAATPATGLPAAASAKAGAGRSRLGKHDSGRHS